MYKLTDCARILLLIGVLAVTQQSMGQESETEPNNACLAAQDMGSLSLPFSISGSLDTLNDEFDIDFFRFSGVAGPPVQADYQGSAAGSGTLPDPLLGLFDADCNLISLNDDAGGPDSRLIFALPRDGIFILAATAFPDFGFAGSGEGSYVLSLSAVALADSISGRLVSANGGAPLPGDGPPFATVQLIRCIDGSCFEYVNSQNTSGDGSFLFNSDLNGGPLLAGTYQLQAFASGFDFLTTGSFDVAEGESLNLGNVAMIPLSFIGSVSGRIVDAISGAPLSGFGPPFAFATLERCDEFGCVGQAGSQADEQGRFRFEGVIYGLPPGTYRISASADEYMVATTEQFDLAESQDIEVGDIAISPFRLQFGEVQGCALPPGGGLCEYSIELRNRGPGWFRGEAWSTVDFFPNESPFRSSRFQVGSIGAQLPLPERINLRAGQSIILTFQLFVPGTVPPSSTICATATVGTNPFPQFDNHGDRFVFCTVTTEGDFELMPEKEGRKRFRELKPIQMQSGPGRSFPARVMRQRTQ